MTLRDIQRGFYRAARREASLEELEALFQGDMRLSAADRINVYAGAYFARQINALAEFFPRTRSLLGPHFVSLARNYVRNHPGTGAAIETFCEYFPRFLSATSDSLALAADLASLEWTRAAVLLSPVAPPSLTAEELTRLDPEAAMQLTRASRLVHAGPTALSLFESACSEDGSTQTPSETLASASLQRDAQERITLLFVRKGFAVRQRKFERQHDPALALLQRGTSLISLCELLADDPEPSQRVHALLSQLLRDEALTLGDSPASDRS